MRMAIPDDKLFKKSFCPSKPLLAHQFAVDHLRTAVLDKDEVQCRTFRERGNLFVPRVTLQLRDALLALRVQLRLLRALLDVLELDDVTVWR